MQNRLYMKDIGPLPPYPFLTFTLMQLLLYVFLLLLVVHIWTIQIVHMYMNEIQSWLIENDISSI